VIFHPYEDFQAADRAATALHDRAMLLGYNVGFNFAGELGRPPEVSFWVRRFDQSPETRQSFATVEQASKHLDDVEKLQVYCLALVGNPRIEVVTESDNDGKVT
jgi:hypothetical protein